MSFREPFQHREALLAASVEAFVDRGFDGASLNAILAAAGMSKGQFYHHFRDKDELYLGVVEALVDRKRAWFEAHPVALSTDPFTALGELIRAGLEFSRQDPQLDAFGRAFLRERGRPIFARALERFSAGAAPGVAEVLGRGFAAGAFRGDLPPAFVARAIGVVLQHVTDLLGDRPEEIERGLDHAVRFLRGGLGADPGGRGGS